MATDADVTGWLVAWQQGNQAAQGQLLETVYGELKQLARMYLRREYTAHSVSPSMLVHEAYLKLVDQRVSWQNRSHFFGVAAQAMRRVLVDRARAARTAKRRGGVGMATLEQFEAPAGLAAVDLIALDAALARLEALDARWAQLVELRYFAGLSISETADVLHVSPATVKRDWSLARAWLYRELSSEAQRAGPLEATRR